MTELVQYMDRGKICGWRVYIVCGCNGLYSIWMGVHYVGGGCIWYVGTMGCTVYGYSVHCVGGGCI